jgi:hypothetical protein
MGCAVAVYILYSLPSIVTANRIAYVFRPPCWRKTVSKYVSVKPAISSSPPTASRTFALLAWILVTRRF